MNSKRASRRCSPAIRQSHSRLARIAELEENRYVWKHVREASWQRSSTDIRKAGLYKSERVIETPQNAHIRVAGGAAVLNMCANNYLGLADHPAMLSRRHTRPSTAGATGLRRFGSSAARRPSTSSWNSEISDFPRHRGHDSLQLLL